MTFVKDNNGNWIDDFTGTRFSIYHFDVNGINEFTGTIWDEEGYNQYGEDKNGLDRDHRKADRIVQDSIVKKENIRKKSDDKYFNMEFDLNFFESDLEKNRPLIEKKIRLMESDYDYANRKSSELRSGMFDAVERRDFDDMSLFWEEAISLNYFSAPIPPDLDKTLNDPYFFFCTDDNFTYISNENINVFKGDKMIIPFTSARARKLRFGGSGNNKYQLTFLNGKISLLKKISGEEKRSSINDVDVKSIDQVLVDRQSITGKVKKSGVGDISKLMKSEQDRIMSAPAKGVTLISGVAGSGKTNILLHRIQYLLWEQPGKENANDVVFHQNNIIFLCFNKALQKYIESSIKDKFPKICVKTIDQWGLDIFKEYFQNEIIKFDEDFDFNIDEIRNIVDNYIANLTASNVGDFYVEKSWSSFEIKEGNSKKLQGTAIVSVNPKVIGDLFGDINYYTKKHLLTWLYLLSISNLEQDGPNTFSLSVGNKKFNNLRLKGRTNVNIDYIFEKNMYDHIFIDEVQDLSPAWIQIVNGFHKNSMTIAGDESQLLTVGKIGSQLSDIFGIKIDQKYDLVTSHRNSQQTALFANEFLKKVKFKNEIQAISFKGLQPLVKNVGNPLGELEYLVNKIKDLKSNEPGATICVVFPRKNDASNCVGYLQSRGIDCYLANSGSWDFGKTVHITNYHQAKGLEFDYVFICGINDFDTWSVQNKNNIMYTLITRGIKRVYITLYGSLPNIFEGVDSSTYIFDS